MPLSMTCLKCGRRQTLKMYYTIPELAEMFEVRKETIGVWMRRGLLPYRFWPRGGGSLSRIVPADDLQFFFDNMAPRPDELRSDSPSARARLAYKLLSWCQATGRKGPEARKAKRAARKNGPETGDVSKQTPGNFAPRALSDDRTPQPYDRRERDHGAAISESRAGASALTPETRPGRLGSRAELPRDGERSLGGRDEEDQD